MNSLISQLPSPIPFLPILRALGLTAPAVYAGITWSFDAIVLPPLLSFTVDETVLAKQWLLAYQIGPRFVRKAMMVSLVGNGGLAVWHLCQYSSGDRRGGKGWQLAAGLSYLMATVVFLSVGPYTFVGMERGINGAGKWKCRALFEREKEKEVGSRDTGGGRGGAGKEGKGREDLRWLTPEFYNTATRIQYVTPEWKNWAEKVSMREIVLMWQVWNRPRIWIGWAAALASLSGAWVGS
ncbi:MAG: hypothetical protein M1820_005701 [Bogoriella megaspora]|nr:MAG: hypothetical protein M1820_005701 [Bogoriella megaspora]